MTINEIILTQNESLKVYLKIASSLKNSSCKKNSYIILSNKFF